MKYIIICLLWLVPLNLWGQRSRSSTESTREQALAEALAYYQCGAWAEARQHLDKYVSLLARTKQTPDVSAQRLGKRLDLVERLESHAEKLELIDSLRLPIPALALGLERLLRSDDGGNHVGTFRIEYRPDSSLLFGYTTPDRRVRLESVSYLEVDSAVRYDRIGGRMEQTPNAFSGLEIQPAFPILLTDGIRIIFAQRSDEGLGGYDLYLSRQSIDTGLYFRPTHLGLPFNSPANDYLLIYDELRDETLLVSDRYAPNGQVHIYRYKGAPKLLGIPTLPANAAN